MAKLSDFTVKQLLDASPSVLYCVNAQESIVSAGLHLSVLDVEGVVALNQSGGADGIIIGYNVLRLIKPANLWSIFYQTKISNAKMRVLSVNPNDGLNDAVKNIMKRGWGYAIVLGEDGKPTNLIGLLDLAVFYTKSGIADSLRTIRIHEKGSSPVLTISEKATALMAIRTMLDKHVRRLLVEESELVLSDRGIIKWLLSPTNVERLRDSPKEVLESSVSTMSPMLHKPSLVEPDTDAATALDFINKYDARCVITKDHKRILTPWDLTIRLLAK